jgi:hypothetical protein
MVSPAMRADGICGGGGMDDAYEHVGGVRSVKNADNQAAADELVSARGVTMGHAGFRIRG